MEPISSKTVVQQIIEQMTTAITTHRFQLGQKLPSEFELMEELNVSRNSLREAMKIMSATGIVEIRRGDGTYICSKPNPGFFDSILYSMMFESSTDVELVELRQVLDEAILKLAICKVKEEEILQLQKYIDEMRLNFRNGNLSKAAMLDYNFHIYLADCSRNTFLVHIVKGVYEIFKSSIENNIRTEELFARADENHQLIVDCLKKGDERMIPNVIAQSLSSWKRNMKKKT